MNMDVSALTPIIIALVGSAGLWTFLKVRSENEFKAREAEREYRGEFNETLRQQVERMSTKLDKLADDKEELLKEIATLRSELGEAKATIKHLETMLMQKR